MKIYDSPLEALVQRLHFMHEQGEFNSLELERRMLDAGFPEEERIGSSTFRMLRLGVMPTLSERRVIAACRVLGIEIAVKDPAIPDRWKRKDKS
jgi:hypothetical protein